MNKGSEIVVTIRCITYNHEPYIRQCLNGFVMQKTNFKFEAIVHDDASTDGTAAIIAEFAKKYPDIIKPLYETENQYSKRDGSLQRIMNAHMHGKYIAYCEGDDYWIDPLKLQKQVDFLETNPEYVLCYTDFNILDQRKAEEVWHYNILERGFLPIIIDFKTHLQQAGYIAPCSWLILNSANKEIEDHINTMKPAPTDGSFVKALECFLRYKVAYLPYATCVYRRNNGSATNQASRQKKYMYKRGVYDIQLQYSEYLQKQDKQQLLNIVALRYIKSAIRSKRYKDIQNILEVVCMKRYGIFNYLSVLKITVSLFLFGLTLLYSKLCAILSHRSRSFC